MAQALGANLDAVEIVAQDGWAELVMNRPERRNAISAERSRGDAL